jgi:hypothetical protein
VRVRTTKLGKELEHGNDETTIGERFRIPLREAIDALADFLAKMISNPGDMRRAFDLCREQRVRRKRVTESMLDIVEMPFETALAELEQIIDGRDDRLGLGAAAKGRSDCAGFRQGPPLRCGRFC